MTPHVPFSVIPTLAHLLVTLPRGYAHRKVEIPIFISHYPYFLWLSNDLATCVVPFYKLTPATLLAR